MIDVQEIKTWLAVILYGDKNKIIQKILIAKEEGEMGLVLVLMMFTSITLLGLWEKKRSRKRFQEAVRKLRELEAVTLTKTVKQQTE